MIVFGGLLFIVYDGLLIIFDIVKRTYVTKRIGHEVLRLCCVFRDDVYVSVLLNSWTNYKTTVAYDYVADHWRVVVMDDYFFDKSPLMCLRDGVIHRFQKRRYDSYIGFPIFHSNVIDHIIEVEEPKCMMCGGRLHIVFVQSLPDFYFATGNRCNSCSRGSQIVIHNSLIGAIVNRIQLPGTFFLYFLCYCYGGFYISLGVDTGRGGNNIHQTVYFFEDITSKAPKRVLEYYARWIDDLLDSTGFLIYRKQIVLQEFYCLLNLETGKERMIGEKEDSETDRYKDCPSSDCREMLNCCFFGDWIYIILFSGSIIAENTVTRNVQIFETTDGVAALPNSCDVNFHENNILLKFIGLEDRFLYFVIFDMVTQTKEKIKITI